MCHHASSGGGICGWATLYPTSILRGSCCFKGTKGWSASRWNHYYPPRLALESVPFIPDRHHIVFLLAGTWHTCVPCSLCVLRSPCSPCSLVCAHAPADDCRVCLQGGSIFSGMWTWSRSRSTFSTGTLPTSIWNAYSECATRRRGRRGKR